MTKLLLVAIGGGAGTAGRYMVAGAVHRISGASFPFGTLVVNVAGCLLIGLLAAVFSGPLLVREEYRVAVLVGLLGGLTTFSTYAWETLALASDGQYWRAAINVIASNVAGLVAAWAGYRAALGWFGW